RHWATLSLLCNISRSPGLSPLRPQSSPGLPLLQRISRSVHASRLPSVPPRSRAPARAGGTLLFYSSASGRGIAFCFRDWAEADATRIDPFGEGADEKSRPLCGPAFH